MSRLAQAGKDDFQQPAYFLGNFVVDRFGLFFSSPLTAPSAGLSRQIRALISTNFRLNC
jgi:hypothetical protein